MNLVSPQADTNVIVGVKEYKDGKQSEEKHAGKKEKQVIKTNKETEVFKPKLVPRNKTTCDKKKAPTHSKVKTTSFKQVKTIKKQVGSKKIEKVNDISNYFERIKKLNEGSEVPENKTSNIPPSVIQGQVKVKSTDFETCTSLQSARKIDKQRRAELLHETNLLESTNSRKL